ncbi:MAG: antibiotic biosynthesis monooxygenase [Lutibacter sp.]|jgi:heme-degrading monooxygenase HmoA|nr:antibiotic biosynthesis monooxygenase [Lutibacter sp.]
MIANTPVPPYYAVIFTSLMTKPSESYHEMADSMLMHAQQQEGFLGFEHAREQAGITVSYWASLEAIQAWRQHSEHQKAIKKGRSTWYNAYKVRICKVTRDYDAEK